MSRDTAQGRTHRPRLSWLAVLSLTILFVPSAVSASGLSASAAKTTSTNPICSKLGTSIQASSGAQMYCFGPQATQGGTSSGTLTTGATFSKNVDAASTKEDITPNGTQAYGQSEVSIAGMGNYVVEGWNDATGFFAPCPSPNYKEELTGLGFSANGGTSFTDQGGLPNNCTTGWFYEGDPSVETWHTGGATYFYISSLYLNVNTGLSDIAFDACKATGTGSSAKLTCHMPTIAATGAPGDFLDKDFMSIDPQRGRLYVSYTRFTAAGASQIELAVCNLSGTPFAPVCYPGASTSPYLALVSTTTCESEGAYPAVDVKTGSVYVAWEYNWATNYLVSACTTSANHVSEQVAYVPYSCLTLTSTSACAGPAKTASVNIVSMDTAMVPGYNRFPANDFPRIAVSEPKGTVTIVWNDARNHPLGDILMQSFALGSLAHIQSSPVRVNSAATGGLHFLPALRNADSGGNLDITFYQRNEGDTTLTDVYAALKVNPKATTPPSSNVRVTDNATDWNAVSSDIIPNFGDYTDNYVKATTSGPTWTSSKLYVAWSDGRLGDPQPFESYTTAG